MIGLVQAGEDAGAVAALLGLLALVGGMARRMIRTIRKLGHLADEVLGDGERPGWGRRLTALEQQVAAVRVKTEATLAEVKPNGGASLKDQVTRIERATGAKEAP